MVRSSARHWGLTLLLYSAFIFWLSSAPRELPMADFRFQDKLIHLAAYGLLALIAMEWLASIRFGTPFWQGAVGALYAALYGVSDEWHQSFVPGRFPEFADWVADGLGAVMAMALFLTLRHRSSSPQV